MRREARLVGRQARVGVGDGEGGGSAKSGRGERGERTEITR